MNLIRENLFCTSHQRVLSFLLDHPSSFHTEKEVVNTTSFEKSAVNKALRELAESGIILQKKEGRMSFYSVDINDPLIRSLKITQNILLLRALIQELKKESPKIILFGSFSKGTNTENSDIDLFVLSNQPDKIPKIVEESSLAERVQLVVKKPADFVGFDKENPVFYQEIEKGFTLWEANE